MGRAGEVRSTHPMGLTRKSSSAPGDACVAAQRTRALAFYGAFSLRLPLAGAQCHHHRHHHHHLHRHHQHHHSRRERRCGERCQSTPGQPAARAFPVPCPRPFPACFPLLPVLVLLLAGATLSLPAVAADATAPAAADALGAAELEFESAGHGRDEAVSAAELNLLKRFAEFSDPSSFSAHGRDEAVSGVESVDGLVERVRATPCAGCPAGDGAGTRSSSSGSNSRRSSSCNCGGSGGGAGGVSGSRSNNSSSSSSSNGDQRWGSQRRLLHAQGRTERTGRPLGMRIVGASLRPLWLGYAPALAGTSAAASGGGLRGGAAAAVEQQQQRLLCEEQQRPCPELGDCEGDASAAASAASAAAAGAAAASAATTGTRVRVCQVAELADDAEEAAAAAYAAAAADADDAAAAVAMAADRLENMYRGTGGWSVKRKGKAMRRADGSVDWNTVDLEPEAADPDPGANTKECDMRRTALSGAVMLPGCRHSGVGEGDRAKAGLQQEQVRRQQQGREGSGDGGGGGAAGWSAQVFVLRDVFVNEWGAVFNSSHLFLPGDGCLSQQLLLLASEGDGRSAFEFDYGPETRVREHNVVANIAVAPISVSASTHTTHQPGLVEEVVERLPLLLLLSAVVRKAEGGDGVARSAVEFVLEGQGRAGRHGLAGTEGLAGGSRHRMLNWVSTHLLGAHPAERMLQLQPNTLVFVRHLIQPVHQSCGHPSPTAWSTLRHAFLSTVAPGKQQQQQQQQQKKKKKQQLGLPLLHKDWSVRSPALLRAALVSREWQQQQQQQQEEEEGSRLPLQLLPPLRDWVVVVAATAPLAEDVVLYRDGWYSNYDPDFSVDILDVVRDRFWLNRVVVLDASFDPNEGMELLRRALLLITASGIDRPSAAAAFIPFMPPEAHVLELRARPSLPLDPSQSSMEKGKPQGRPGMAFHGNSSPLIRSLAAACGLVYTSVLCELDPNTTLAAARSWGSSGGGASPPPGGSGSRARSYLFCSRSALATALDWVEPRVFEHPSLPLSHMHQQLRLKQRSIPGSGYPGPAYSQPAVALSARFRFWSQCVANRGQWVYRPQPRRFPWDYRDVGYQCEARRRQAARESGSEGPSPISGSFADRIVSEIAEKMAVGNRTGAEAARARWNVREGLKYNWEVPEEAGCMGPLAEPSGRLSGRSSGGQRVDLRRSSHLSLAAAAEETWVPWDAEGFCRLVGPGFRILVLGDSIQYQLAVTILNNLLIDVNKPAIDHLEIEEHSEECTRWLGEGAASAQRNEYCRLQRIVNVSYCPGGITVDYVRHDLFKLNRPPFPRFDRIPWALMRQNHSNIADVIIVNTGPHWQPMREFKRTVASSLRFLRMMYPSKLIIFRNTPAGHANCLNFEVPLKRPQRPEDLWFNWAKFATQNAAAKRIADQLGVVYMDVEAMTALRADSHKGINYAGRLDCLHYCFPGPLDAWMQYLYNIFLKLKLPNRKQLT